MARVNNRKYQICKSWTIALSEEQKKMVYQKGIKAENIRHFIENFERETTGAKISSNDWMRLRDIISRTPSLQLCGDLAAGKTFLIKQLIFNDLKRIYIVMDSHHEFMELEEIRNIATDLKKSCRLIMPSNPEGAIGMFKVYYNLIMNSTFPNNYVLVVEEALRYKGSGLINLLAEARKFIYVLAITQQKIVDFCPYLYVDPYVKFHL